LIQLREANKNHLTNLLEKCRKDYREQTIKKKLENVNNQVFLYQICIYIPRNLARNNARFVLFRF